MSRPIVTTLVIPIAVEATDVSLIFHRFHSGTTAGRDRRLLSFAARPRPKPAPTLVPFPAEPAPPKPRPAGPAPGGMPPPIAPLIPAGPIPPKPEPNRCSVCRRERICPGFMTIFPCTIHTILFPGSGLGLRTSSPLEASACTEQLQKVLVTFAISRSLQ